MVPGDDVAAAARDGQARVGVVVHVIAVTMLPLRPAVAGRVEVDALVAAGHFTASNSVAAREQVDPAAGVTRALHHQPLEPDAARRNGHDVALPHAVDHRHPPAGVHAPDRQGLVDDQPLVIGAAVHEDRVTGLRIADGFANAVLGAVGIDDDRVAAGHWRVARRCSGQLAVEQRDDGDQHGGRKRQYREKD